MKKYKAIFFDWDGTAVISRGDDAKEVIGAMETLLCKGIPLVIISGTTYKNICGGRLHELLSKKALKNLYLGLARGNYDYSFDESGSPSFLYDATPAINELLALHRAATEVHCRLLEKYGLRTDIVFSRPNYCKIDVMVDFPRNETLFLQDGETDRVAKMLDEHGIHGGLNELINISVDIGKSLGVELKATTDAKHLELGYTTKSDNVNRFIKYFEKLGISAEDCCFWGDEFGEIAPKILGSDSQMITELTEKGGFYSVSKLSLVMPEKVTHLGGGPQRFIEYLKERALED